jgi:positive regulator of sigma E activity
MVALIRLICAIVIAFVAYVIAAELGLPRPVSLIVALLGLLVGWVIGPEVAARV